MASKADFVYGPPLQGRNIRLIKAGPDFKSTLEINLVERSLESVKFEALSYVWCNQATKRQIKCNGQIMRIGSNLLDVFCELALRQFIGFIWVDAICINQNDKHEKTRQVRMMRDIYEKAERVIIWLGKEQSSDRSGFELAKSLYQKCNGSSYNMYATTFDFEDFDCTSRGVPKPFGNLDWAALFNILSNAWFGRIWVVQELLVAQRSIMLRGALDLNTEIILWVALHIGRHRNLYESFNNFTGDTPFSALMARNIATGYIEYKARGPLPIYDTLSRYNGMNATDPRDRYFALAGISAGLEAGFVNYEKPYRDIACLVGKMALLGFPGYWTQPEGDEMLFFAGNLNSRRFPIEWLAFHSNPQNHNLGLPSWVPDIVSAHSPGLLMSGFYNTDLIQEEREIPSPELRLRQGISFEWSGSVAPNHIPVPDDIEIMGAEFDHIETLARMRPPIPNANLETGQLLRGGINILVKEAMVHVCRYETEMVHWLSEIRALADPTLRAPDSIMAGSDSSFDAFWRTLVYNRGPKFNYESPNQKPDTSLGISFGYWYLLKKLYIRAPWQPDLFQNASNHMLLSTLSRPFDMAEGRVAYARRFFVSGTGRFGWVPLRTEVSDKVCVLQGMRIPVILRPRGERWEFIGACYVHGLMDGEIWDLDDLKWKFISFV